MNFHTSQTSENVFSYNHFPKRLFQLKTFFNENCFTSKQTGPEENVQFTTIFTANYGTPHQFVKKFIIKVVVTLAPIQLIKTYESLYCSKDGNSHVSAEERISNKASKQTQEKLCAHKVCNDIGRSETWQMHCSNQVGHQVYCYSHC